MSKIFKNTMSTFTIVGFACAVGFTPNRSNAAAVGAFASGAQVQSIGFPLLGIGFAIAFASAVTGIGTGVAVGMVLNDPATGENRGTELTSEAINYLGLSEEHRVAWNTNIEAMVTALSSVDQLANSDQKMQLMFSIAAVSPQQQKLIAEVLTKSVAKVNEISQKK